MMRLFKETPRPRQLCWGDVAARQRLMRVDDASTPLEWVDVTCLDVCGCRKNALLERNWLPVGSPLDTIVPAAPTSCRFSILHGSGWKLPSSTRSSTPYTTVGTFTPWKPSRC